MADPGAHPFHSSFRALSGKEAEFRGRELRERRNDRERLGLRGVWEENSETQGGHPSVEGRFPHKKGKEGIPFQGVYCAFDFSQRLSP